jgi:hypothetical protein
VASPVAAARHRRPAPPLRPLQLGEQHCRRATSLVAEASSSCCRPTLKRHAGPKKRTAAITATRVAPLAGAKSTCRSYMKGRRCRSVTHRTTEPTVAAPPRCHAGRATMTPHRLLGDVRRRTRSPAHRPPPEGRRRSRPLSESAGAATGAAAATRRRSTRGGGGADRGQGT